MGFGRGGPLPAHAHAGLTADAVDIVAEGDVELCEHRLALGLKKFTPAETSPQTSWRSSLRMKLVPVETSVA
jgi:hypothetical protein